MSKPQRLIGIIAVVPLPEGCEAVCTDCKKILARGMFAIGITDDMSQYYVEHNPSVECCGVERSVPLLYMNLDKATQKKRSIKATVETDGNLQSLILQEVEESMRWSTKH